MIETRTTCDLEGCTNSCALRFSFFKQRISDGAGDMEDWDYTFDLCSNHTATFLSAVFDFIKHTPFTLETALLFCRKFQIKTRIE